MKKISIISLLLVAMLAVLTACAPSTFETINELVKSADKYTLTVETTTNGEKLTSKYDIVHTESGYTVSYTYEVLNKLSLDGSQSGYKSTKSGTATVVDGQVSSSTGDAIDVIPAKLSLNFVEGNFSDVVESEGSFVANITNGKAFLSKNFNGSNAKISVTYSAEKLTKIVIEYATEKSTVVVTYDFSK